MEVTSIETSSESRDLCSGIPDLDLPIYYITFVGYDND